MLETTKNKSSKLKAGQGKETNKWQIKIPLRRCAAWRRYWLLYPKVSATMTLSCAVAPSRQRICTVVADGATGAERSKMRHRAGHRGPRHRLLDQCQLGLHQKQNQRVRNEWRRVKAPGLAERGYTSCFHHGPGPPPRSGCGEAIELKVDIKNKKVIRSDETPPDRRPLDPPMGISSKTFKRRECQ